MLNESCPFWKNRFGNLCLRIYSGKKLGPKCLLKLFTSYSVTEKVNVFNFLLFINY